MRIGLVGSTAQSRSLPYNAQRTVNLFPVLDQQAKQVAALSGTPGLELFSTAGSGPIRGCFTSSNGRSFFISGSSVYEIDVNGASTYRGLLNTSLGNVTIDENATQLFICDGNDGYIFTYATNALAVVSDGDFPTAGTVTYSDGYFVVNQVDTGKFYISALNNGASWDALDFATAESSPDKLKRVIRGIGQLWLFGDKTTEIWTNTGDASFPFQKISGAELEVGIMSAYTAVAYGSTMFWVGQSNEGNCIVYRANGFRPQPISTEAISLLISQATDKSNITGYVYQQDGHDFYVLTGGGLATSLVYDISTELWHERAYLESDGSFGLHLASCCTFAFNQHLVGDRRNGKIYRMSLDVYSDDGDYIARERVYTHLSNEGERVRYNSLEIDMEVGVGLTSGQGSSPEIVLYISKDGAKTWSNGITGGIGAIGDYTKKVAFRRIGVAEVLTFKIRITDPVKVFLIGSYLK